MIRIGFLLPHFRAGGAERCVLNWIGALDRSRFAPVLLLKRVEGQFLDLLPTDVTPIALGAARALRLPRHIGAALAEHRIDVAYSATNAMNLALLVAPTGARRVVSEHTPPAAYLAEAKFPLLRRAAMRRLYPRADAVAVPTEQIATELRATVGRGLAIETLPNPVVADIAEILPRIPHPVAQLVAAGRLVPAKGYDVLIQACARLDAQAVRFHLTIYGDGPLRERLAAQIATMGLTRRITLAGHADRLADRLATADLLVLASRREGFGNVIVEAMAAGTPVLATRSGGPETLIHDGTNGFLVAPQDAGALAQAIAALLADPVRRDSVRSSAADTARGFGIATSTRCFENLVERIAATRSTAA